MVELKLDFDEVISLRLGGTIRLYGVRQISSCAILWYDDDHGDNDTCVSIKKEVNVGYTYVHFC